MPIVGSGNITNAPQFVNAPASNFHLKASSLCRDLALIGYTRGNSDLDGTPRKIGVGPDLGCYEYYAVTNGIGAPAVTGPAYPLILSFARYRLLVNLK